MSDDTPVSKVEYGDALVAIWGGGGLVALAAHAVGFYPHYIGVVIAGVMIGSIIPWYRGTNDLDDPIWWRKHV